MLASDQVYAGDRFKFSGEVSVFPEFPDFNQLVLPGGYFLAPWPGPVGETTVEGLVLAFTSNCKAVCEVAGRRVTFPTEVIWSAIRARQHAEATEIVHVDGELTREEAVEIMAARSFRAMLTDEDLDDTEKLI